MTTLQSLSENRFSAEYNAFSVSDLASTSTFVFAGGSTEARGRHSVWQSVISARSAQCFEVLPTSGDASAPYDLRLSTSGAEQHCSLRNDEQIVAALGTPSSIVLDISGLTHQVWAPMLRALISTRIPEIQVMYVEPEKYRSHSTPATLGSFDLSVGFEGIRPVPGFARLARRIASKRRVFVPLLGFEGSRPRLVHTEVDAGIVAPIVGLPGFRLEFATVAVACNQPYLDDVNGYEHLRFARGSCPFEAFDTIAAIADDLEADHLQIAPLGTKPHALGAFLYAMRNNSLAEIVYDHPVRRPNRTEGVGLTHMYNISAFIQRW